jgi:tetratricopeptide (TPR) repeat protein
MRQTVAGSFLVGALLAGTATTARAQGRSEASAEVQGLIEQGEAQYREGRLDEALHTFEQCCKQDPSQPVCWVRRGMILYKPKPAEAVEVLRKALETLPDNLDVKGQLGLALYRAGKTEQAVALLEEVVARRPDSPDLQFQLGQHYVVHVGDGKKGVAAFEAYFRSRPDSASGTDHQVHALSGRAYLLNHQLAEAQRDLEDAVAFKSTDAASRLWLGEAYAEDGKCTRAMASYERVHERLPVEAQRQPSIWYHLASCELQLNRRGLAEKDAIAYTTAQPHDMRGYLLVGDVRAASKNFGRALEAYDTAKKIDPANTADVALIESRRGKALLGQMNYPAAITAYSVAMKTRGDDTDVLAGLAEAYAATQQPKQKLAELGERLAKVQNNNELRVTAGLAFYAAGEDQRALAEFEAALAVDPKAHRARTGLRMALTRLAGAAVDKGDFAGAEQMLVRAQRLMPESVQTNRNLGLVLLAAKKYAEAETALKLALARVDHDRVLNQLLGRAAAAQHKRDEAVRYYETAAQAALPHRGPALAEVYTELGPLYVEAGRYDEAVKVLETAVKESPGDKAAQQSAAARNLALALLRRGLERLKDPHQADGALDDLARAANAPRGALAAREAAALQCASALATLKAGKPQAALEGLARASREGGCQFRAPYDKLGLEFFSAYAGYRETNNSMRLEAAAKAFAKMRARASGKLADLLRELERSASEFECVDQANRGERKKASIACHKASNAPTKMEHRELDNNLAALDIEDGRLDTAERALNDLGTRPPEALANLGIISDRKGDAKKALDLYKRALERGVTKVRLKEWIDVKERMFKPATGGGK